MSTPNHRTALIEQDAAGIAAAPSRDEFVCPGDRAKIMKKITLALTPSLLAVTLCVRAAEPHLLAVDFSVPQGELRALHGIIMARLAPTA